MMKADEPVVRELLRRAMVARIASLSRNGRPSVNPLYFIHYQGKIWLGTSDWTLAARNVKADPRVSILFHIEQDPGDPRIFRISGRARVRTDAETMRPYNLRVARKYLLSPGGIRNTLAHWRQFWLQRRYRAQSAQKGRPCVIEVTPEYVELISTPSTFTK
jgi:general stress protein 26